MASMMDEMQKSLARRRAKIESGEVAQNFSETNQSNSDTKTAIADEIEHLSIDGM